MMLGELNPCGGGDPIPLTQSRLLVGRRSQCDITLKFKSISSQHCEFELKGGYWHVRDLGSTNGIKVNGLRVDSKVLMPGDEVMIAKHAFNINYDVEPDSVVPEEDNPFALSLMEKAGLEVKRSAAGRMPAASNRSATRSSRKGSAKDQFLMEWFSEE